MQITNLAPAIEAMAWIELHPERHNQSSWAEVEAPVEQPPPAGHFCGARLCLAGWICVAAGRNPVWTDLAPDNDGFLHAYYIEALGPEEELVSIPELAGALLGAVTAYSLQDDALFAEDNSMDDLYGLLGLASDVEETEIRRRVTERVAELAATEAGAAA